MVDYSIIYEDDEKDFSDVACFGELKGEGESFHSEETIQEIVYYPGGEDYRGLLSSLLNNHPVLSKPIISGGPKEVRVDPNHPADLVLGALSFARTLFCPAKGRGERIIRLLKKGYKTAVATFIIDSLSTNSGMFQYIEESLVQDWGLEGFIEWLENPVDRSIEGTYSDTKTYSSVKTSLSGKPFPEYKYATEGKLSPCTPLIEIIRWEKGKEFLFRGEAV